jgi:hypothetical protein
MQLLTVSLCITEMKKFVYWYLVWAEWMLGDTWQDSIRNVEEGVVHDFQ